MNDVSAAGTDAEAGAAAAPGGPRSRLRARIAGVAALAAAGILAGTIRCDIKGHAQGLFLLRPAQGSRLEITDDLFLGEGSRLLVGVSFSPVRNLLRRGAPLAPGEASLELDWDEVAGNGLVRNKLEDGRQVVTVFSRYDDSFGAVPHGLFVGGSLAEVAADESRENESGMAILDQHGWRHVWCNVNEVIDDPRKGPQYPSAWKFLGSRVLVRDAKRVVLESSHELEIGGEPVRVDRFAYFRAGDPWFKLGIHVVNAGGAPVRFTYGYGDEPWVGNYGSGETNVGWVEEGIIRTVRMVDPKAHRWAGILDEREKIANFVSWGGEQTPSLIYFANHSGLGGETIGAPLASNEVFIGLEWDRTLRPGEDVSILLSLGVADMDRQTGVPRLPPRSGAW